MMKRLPWISGISIGVLAWIVGGAAIGGAIVFVASKEHTAAEEYEAAREKRCGSSFPLDSEKQDACKHERDGPYNYLPWGYVLLAWPDAITTWAIIATGFVIAWQANETRKTAKASWASIRLQEAAMQQWVDIMPVDAEIQVPRAGIKDFPFTVNLSFEAVNNTAHPFDILKIVTKIGKWAYEWEVFTIETNVTLAPQQDSPIKRYPFYVPTQSITKIEIENGTLVTINGEITFKNCLGKIQTDYFGGFYRCEGDTFRYLKATGLVPERTEEKESQNPN